MRTMCRQRCASTHRTVIAVLLPFGLVFLALAAGLMVCAFKSKSRHGKTHIRLMPLFSILAFMSLLAGMTLIIGGATTRVSVSVYGSEEDRVLYQRLVSTAERRYKFYTLNKGARGQGHPVAVSCNAAQLSAFVTSTQQNSGVEIEMGSDENCAKQSALANFFDPHIALYLR